MEDESDWEHRVIKNIVWWRSRGYTVESYKWGTHESIDNYLINSCLFEMIRDSPHNTCHMYTQIDKSEQEEVSETSEEEDVAVFDTSSSES